MAEPRHVLIPVNDLARAATRDLSALGPVVQDVVASGWYVQGPNVSAFQVEFAEFLGVSHCVGVGNGTDALELALRALRIGPGHRVATTANAGFYTSSAALAVGADLCYIEIEPESMLMDLTALELALRDGLDAVVLTHLYGDASKAPEAARLCRAYGVPLIEDCAQAAGAIMNGSRAGSFGSIGTFSFYPTKNLGALGDGGALVTDSDELAASVRSVAQYGWASRYDVRRPGRNSRLDELQAAILRVRLPGLDELNARRRDICARYTHALDSSPLRLRYHATPTEHVAHLAIVNGARVRVARESLFERGVRTDVHYPIPDHLQAIWNGTRTESLPVTEAVAERIFTVPCFPEMTDGEVEHVCRALDEVSHSLADQP
jgi:dTDP-4-amino-4,6-dideoxygalactose transaminase